MNAFYIFVDLSEDNACSPHLVHPVFLELRYHQHLILILFPAKCRDTENNRHCFVYGLKHDRKGRIRFYLCIRRLPEMRLCQIAMAGGS